MRTAFPDYMLADSIGYQLRLTSSLARRHYLARLAEAGIGLSPEQITLLTLLARDDGWALGALAAANGHDKAAVTRMAQAMQASGWIQVQADPESRNRKRVSITPAGRRLLARVDAVTRAKERELHELLGRDERRVLLRLLAKLHSGLELPPEPAS